MATKISRWALAVIAVAGFTRAGAASLGGGMAATTNYVFRGLSQSDQGPAIQGDLHWQTGAGWFGGVWASNVNAPPDREGGLELNLYLGHTWTLSSDFSASAHVVRYLYPDSTLHSEYNYSEIQGNISFQDRATLSVARAKDVLRYSFASHLLERGWEGAYELSVRQPLWRDFAMTAGLGFYNLPNLPGSDYWAGDLGLDLSLGAGHLTLTRFMVDGRAARVFGRPSADGHWTLAAGWRF